MLDKIISAKELLSMRKWMSYAIMCLLFFSINLILSYTKEDDLNLIGSLSITALFIVFLVGLDGLAIYINRKKKEQSKLDD